MDFETIQYGVYFGFATGTIALLTVFVFLRIVLAAPKQADNSARMNHMVEIAGHIQQGSKAFLSTEYKYLFVFVIVVGVAVGLSSNLEEDVSANQGWNTAANFGAGAFLSGLAGWLGMYTATQSNVRTTTCAASHGLNAALKLAFKSGAVMGFTVVSFGILGLSASISIFLNTAVMAGFGFGASSIALFARVGGGIFTKAADVGADLCGKVAFDLNEDDPRNPAVIADNVGDNVGDVAGMGADLFESYVGSIIACMTLAGQAGVAFSNGDVAKTTEGFFILPFFIAGSGIICSIVGTFFVSVKEGGNMNDLLWAIRRGLFVASLLVVGASFAVTFFMAEEGYFSTETGFRLFGAILVGLISGLIIGTATEFCTSFEYFPTQSISMSGLHGHAPVIIQGMGVGMLSTVVPVIVIVIAILACLGLCGLYGVAIAGVGMLSTLGITLATDAYGPVADNAGGIAEMAELDSSVRDTTDALDALGNTTAATGKGFAIGSAVLTAIALMASFIQTSQIESGSIDIMEDVVIPGVLIGSMLPFVFAALTMLSVRRGAHAIMDEVKLQFTAREDVKSRTGSYDDWSPNHQRCVAIATESAILEMVVPGAMAVIAPVAVGFGLGAKALTGMLVGSISSGFLLAVTMANAGGAWDNAKKWVEAGGVSGHGKGSQLHKAVVTGDTVGDPFKDTSGPALNILIKLMSVVSLVFAPVFPASPYEDLEVAIALLVVLAVLCSVMWIKITRNDTGYSQLQDGQEMS